MSATNRGCERKAYDFYATPPETVRAFLANFDGISAGDRILEPSAGNGQIVKVLREGGARATVLEPRRSSCCGTMSSSELPYKAKEPRRVPGLS